MAVSVPLPGTSHVQVGSTASHEESGVPGRWVWQQDGKRTGSGLAGRQRCAKHRPRLVEIVFEFPLSNEVEREGALLMLLLTP